MIAELDELARLLNYFLLSKDSVFFTDIDMSIIDVNPKFEELFRYERDNIIGKSFLDLIVRVDYRDDFRLAFNGLKHNIPTDLLNNTLELYFLDSNKNEIPVELFFKGFVFNYNTYFLFIVKDVTEILRKEEDTERQIQDLEFAKEQLEEALLIINENNDEIEDYKLQIQKEKDSIVGFINQVETNSNSILELMSTLNNKVEEIGDETVKEVLNSIKHEIENTKNLVGKYHLESFLRKE